MDEKYSYKLVSVRPRLVILKRGGKTKFKVLFKNTGSEPWFDIGKIKLAELKHAPRIAPWFINEIQARDFKIHWGPENTTDKKFSKVLRRFRRPSINGDKHIVNPGQYAQYVFDVESKKYATRGTHRLEIYLGDTMAAPMSAKGKRLPMVRVNSNRHLVAHFKRALALVLTKPGAVQSEFRNDAYSRISDFKDYTPVVMAVWSRVENLRKTIDSLKSQKDAKPILILWVNNAGVYGQIREVVNTSKLPIKVYCSAKNIGGYGRFFAARAISEQFAQIVFVDDDQFLPNNGLAILNRELKSGEIISAWAHVFLDKVNYWHKRKAKFGEDAHYLGTGGMIIESTIFKDDDVFRCPKLYWYIEDLWLSYIASKRGYRLRGSKLELLPIEDGKDQANWMIDLKTLFYKYLRKKKAWELTYD